MPFPNHRVIPAGWSAHHRPVVNDTFGATIAVRRPGGTPGEFDPETGQTTTTPHDAHYTGGARIQVLPALDQERVTGDQEVTTLGYRVAVAHDAAVEPADGTSVVGCLVLVTAVDANGDASLVGRTLTVESLERGSLAWERDLIVTDRLG